MNLSKLLSSTNMPSLPSQGLRQPQGHPTSDTHRLQRLRRDIQASKRALVALDCDFA